MNTTTTTKMHRKLAEVAAERDRLAAELAKLRAAPAASGMVPECWRDTIREVADDLDSDGDPKAARLRNILDVLPAPAVPADSADGIMSPMNACMHRDTCRKLLQSAPQAPASPADLSGLRRTPEPGDVVIGYEYNETGRHPLYGRNDAVSVQVPEFRTSAKDSGV